MILYREFCQVPCIIIRRQTDDHTPRRLPLSALAPTLFPFFRHTIPNVRLAVVKTLHSFMTVSSLPRDWLGAPVLRLLFQNLVVEERPDIRDASLTAWRAALTIIAGVPDWMESICTQQLILDWYAITMTPLGVPIDARSFYHPFMTLDGQDSAPDRHNVDKNMLAQDLSLISTEVTLKARVTAATALAQLIVLWPSSVEFSLSPARSFPIKIFHPESDRRGTLHADPHALHPICKHASKAACCHHCGGMGLRIRCHLPIGTTASGEIAASTRAQQQDLTVAAS
jgi:hypothetical protein